MDKRHEQIDTNVEIIRLSHPDGNNIYMVTGKIADMMDTETTFNMTSLMKIFDDQYGKSPRIMYILANTAAKDVTADAAVTLHISKPIFKATYARGSVSNNTPPTTI